MPSMHAAILTLHIATGTLGVSSGAAALSLRKGSRPHRVAGSVFVAAMLLMAASASILAAMTAQPGLVVGGLMTIYFIATAWMAGRRKDGETGAFEYAALAMAVAIGLVTLLPAPAGEAKAGGPPVALAGYILDGIIGLAALGDLSVILRRGLYGAQRIARHLWRMCLGLIIAVGSFAAQGANFLPRGVGLPLLLGSMILILAVMLYWLVRVLLTNWYGKANTRVPGA